MSTSSAALRGAISELFNDITLGRLDSETILQAIQQIRTGEVPQLACSIEEADGCLDAPAGVDR